MRTLAWKIPVALAILAAATALQAQTGGCVDSPENPTVILGMIATAVSFGVVRLRGRVGPRKK
jgi:XrtJ-associated TM-motif-TM protein